MTRDKDTSQDGWEESREGGRAKSRSYRPQRPPSDSGDTRARSRPRPVPGRRPAPPRDGRDQVTEPPVERRRQARDFREEDTTTYSQQPQRPRITRQSREDAYARSRQRPFAGGHQRIDPPGRDKSRPYRERDEIEEMPVRTTPRRITNPEEEPYYSPVRRAGTRTTPSAPRRARPPRRRSVGSTLLIGCVGGIATIALIAGIVAFLFFRVLPTAFPGFGSGGSTFSDQQHSVSLSIPLTLTQVQITNSTGNINVSVDTTNPTRTTATLTSTKKVQASSSGNASSEFGRISVTTTGSSASCPPASCLSISTTIPNPTLDAVDLTLVLPASVIRVPSTVNSTPPFTLSATTTVKGDIAVDHFDGTLNLKAANHGNLTVQQGLVFAGSCLFTNNGAITFNAFLDVQYASAVVPCSNTTSTDPHPWYTFRSESGDANITLPATTNVILDANTNTGKLTSEFPLTPPASLIPYCGSSPPTSTYFCGPLIPASTLPSAILKLDVSTGNINIHKG